MQTRHRAVFFAIAIPGLFGSVLAVGRFLLAVRENRLAWHPAQSPREYYQALGSAFSQGFGAGFFLCFFLVLLAVAAGGRRRRSALGATGAAEPGLEVARVASDGCDAGA